VKSLKKSDRNLVIGVVIIGFLVLGYTQGWFNQFLGGFQQQPDRPITNDIKSDYERGIGVFNVKETVVNSLDIASELTSATNYKLYWYTRHGTDWQYEDTGDDKYVELTAAENGILWVVVTIPSGQAYYVDYEKIVSGNSYVVDYLYTDVDGDGTKEFCFQYDMKGHSIPSNGYPVVEFNGFCLAYDDSFTGLNDLGNETGIGGSTTIKYKSYYLAFSAAKKAIALRKVEVKITSTDETKITLDHLNIPGYGYIDGSAFTQSATASDVRYTLTFSNEFDGAHYVKHPANALNEYDMTLALEFTLSSGDDILVTLTAYYFVAQTEASSSTNDTFYAQYS
jgi:hypothetical protein